MGVKLFFLVLVCVTNKIKNMKIYKILFLSALPLFFLSCNNDGTSSEIQKAVIDFEMLKPVDGQVYHLGDTIFLKGSLTIAKSYETFYNLEINATNFDGSMSDYSFTGQDITTFNEYFVNTCTDTANFEIEVIYDEHLFDETDWQYYDNRILAKRKIVCLPN